MAEWSPAVDINFGYSAFYSTSDTNFPEDGALAIHLEQTEGWLFQTLDFELIQVVRENGQVLNFKDSQNIETNLSHQNIVVNKISI